MGTSSSVTAIVYRLVELLMIVSMNQIRLQLNSGWCIHRILKFIGRKCCTRRTCWMYISKSHTIVRFHSKFDWFNFNFWTYLKKTLNISVKSFIKCLNIWIMVCMVWYLLSFPRTATFVFKIQLRRGKFMLN